MFGIKDKGLKALLEKLILSVKDKPQSTRMVLALDLIKQLAEPVKSGQYRTLNPRLRLASDSEENQRARALLKAFVNPELVKGLPSDLDFSLLMKAFIYLNFPRFITKYYRAQGERASLSSLKIHTLDVVVANKSTGILALTLCDHCVTTKQLQRHRQQAPMPLSPDAVSLYGSSEDLVKAIKTLFPDTTVAYYQDESRGDVASLSLAFAGDYLDEDKTAALLRATVTTLIENGVKVDAEFPDLLDFMLAMYGTAAQQTKVYQIVNAVVMADPSLKEEFERVLNPPVDTELLKKTYGSDIVSQWLQQTADGADSPKLFGHREKPAALPVASKEGEGLQP